MQAGEERVRPGCLGRKGSQALFCILASMAKAFISPFQPTICCIFFCQAVSLVTIITSAYIVQT